MLSAFCFHASQKLSLVIPYLELKSKKLLIYVGLLLINHESPSFLSLPRLSFVEKEEIFPVVL